MRIAFRVDASHWVGTGHLMRCKVLADRMRREGAEVLFLSREMPGNRIGWLTESGYSVRRLSSVGEALNGVEPDPPHASWLGVGWQQDRDECLAILREEGRFDWLVVDNYAIDDRWEAPMRRYAGRIAVIDDLADREHDCDLLVDQNIFPNVDQRYSGKVPAGCYLLLGPKFALLQPLYEELHLSMRVRVAPVKKVLVFFGGVDPYNLTGLVARALTHFVHRGLEVDFVVGAEHPHREEMAALVAGTAGAHLHADLPSLGQLMAAADLAIGAGGTTSWERCCLGLPALLITFASNQRAVAAGLRDHGLAVWLGDAEDKLTVDSLICFIDAALMDPTLESMSRRCLETVDGRGAERVLSTMKADWTKSLRLRPARDSDELLLLRWANDLVVRRAGFHSEPIGLAEHRHWLWTCRARGEDCRLLIAETDMEIPAGQVRLELEGGLWTVHYSLDALFRGRGLARTMLTAAIADLRRAYPGCVVAGKVKSENLASRRVFESMGFSLLEESNVLTYMLTAVQQLDQCGTTPQSVAIALRGSAGSEVDRPS